MRRRNKFGNKPQVVDGCKFDSKREAMRWLVLKDMQSRGEIMKLSRQVKFVLAPKVKIAGEARARPEMKFTADFRYFHIAEGRFIVEDAKGFKGDTAFRIRQHLMKSVHGIDVRLS